MPPQLLKQLPIDQGGDFFYIENGSYLHDVPYMLSQWNATKILLVVSKSLDKDTTIVHDLETKLGNLIKSKKQGVGSHSPYADVLAIAHLIQTHSIDSVICIGSGSYSDASKSAVILAESLPSNFSTSDMESLIDPVKGVTTDLSRVKPPRAKLICIPTSLSAGEWNNKASATNPNGKKQHFFHPQGYPRLIILDAHIAQTTPQPIWLSSGVRAIDHCVEAICNPLCTPEAETIALEGLAELIRGLHEYKLARQRKQLQHNDDIPDSETANELLRKGITLSFLGSRLAISTYVVHGNRYGPSHAIGHQLGSVAGVQHGVTSCILLGPVLRFTCTRTKRASVQQRKVLDVFNAVMGWEEMEAADAFERFVGKGGLGLPTRLREVGVTDQEVLEKIAGMTLTDIIGVGPGSLGQEEVLRVLEMAR